MGRRVEGLRRARVESWLTSAIVIGCVVFVAKALSPSLVLADTTANGGDMGAHVWAPAFLRDELLPRWRLSGWAPDWYAGFPAYHFYMVVPALFVVLLDAVGLTYNVAFKLVSVSGLLALPVCAWAMARLARQRFPVPVACAVAATAFVFDRSYTIYGGNALSTLAGEYAFTISLCFALLFLGTVARGLLDPASSGTGPGWRGRALSASLLALCVTCHLIPALFALVGALAIGAVAHADRRRAGSGARRTVGWLAPVVVTGGLLTSFWTVPFLLRRGYLNDMGWQKLTTYLEALFPGRIGRSLSSMAGGAAAANVPGDSTWVIVLAAVGAIASIAFRRRFGSALVIVALVFAVAVRLAPDGRLWNARLLPFWYLCLYLLAALAVAEVLLAAADLVAPAPGSERSRRSFLASGAVVAALVVAVAVGFPLRMLPFGTESPDKSSYTWFGRTTTDRSLVRYWASWDYSGYERKPAYAEYRALVDTMAGLGARVGCGRAMWEYDRTLDRFGTPMSLMLLPYWTDGCIGSMEGLFFEASATTPYHFLNQSELSAAPSRAQAGLPYGALDVGKGVDHLQLLGVRYYIAFSTAAVQQADGQPDLTPVATSGSFRVYEVAGSAVVQALPFEPAVVDDAPAGGEAWQDLAVDWYTTHDLGDVLLAASGPASWARVSSDSLPGADPARRALPDVVVGDVETDSQTISFTVDRPGVPVLVKASYFPNWQADGADGPYRVAPNLMVVVPTSTTVRLHYGRTPVDWLGTGMTGAGVVALGVLAAVARRPRRPSGDEVGADGPPAAVGPPDDERDTTVEVASPAGRPLPAGDDPWQRPPSGPQPTPAAPSNVSRS